MAKFKVQPPVAKKAKSVVIGPAGSDFGLILGRLAEIGPQKDVILDLSREHVVAIVGKRGSGKTHTLGVVAEGLAGTHTPGVHFGHTDATHAVLIFDTLNLFQWMNIPLAQAGGEAAKRQRDEAAKWGITPETIDPVLWHPAGSEAATDSMQFRIRPRDMEAQDWARLMDVDLVNEPKGQLIADTHDKVTRVGWSGGAVVHPPIVDYTVDDMISCLRDDSAIQADYSPETIRAVRQRLTSYARMSLFSALGTELVELLTPGRLTVMLLARVPEDLRGVIVFLLVRRLLEERAAASEQQKEALIRGTTGPDDVVPPTWLLIDEAQNLMPSRSASASNAILTRFVREGRNHGLSLAISTQQPTAIDNRIMAQVDTLIAHTLTVKADVAHVLANSKSLDPTSISVGSKALNLADAIRELDLGQCLVTAVDAERSFFLEIRPRTTMHGGFEQ